STDPESVWRNRIGGKEGRKVLCLLVILAFPRRMTSPLRARSMSAVLSCRGTLQACGQDTSASSVPCFRGQQRVGRSPTVEAAKACHPGGAGYPPLLSRFVASTHACRIILLFL